MVGSPASQARFLVLAISMILCFGFAGQAAAGLFNIGISDLIRYQQTSASAPTTSNNFSLSAFVQEENLGDFTSASLVYPGPGSPASYGAFFPSLHPEAARNFGPYT